MKLIFISGPSGSGKTTLSNQMRLKIKNSLILRTDNYYKTGIISNLLSKFVGGYFDRSISFNYRLLKKDFNFILNNGISYHERHYDFEKKTRKNFLNKVSNIDYLIIEGIFSKEFLNTLNTQNYFFLELRFKKNDCMKRVLQRDLKERGKSKNQAEKDFLKSWDIYHKRFKNNSTKKNEFIITKSTNIEKILEKII